jgi:hypothetical protein
VEEAGGGGRLESLCAMLVEAFKEAGLLIKVPGWERVGTGGGEGSGSPVAGTSTVLRASLPT